MKKGISILTLFLYLCPASYGQGSSAESLAAVITRDSTVTVTTPSHSADTILRTDFQDYVTIYYRFDKATIDSTYLSNAEALKFIDKQLTDSIAMAHLDSLSLNAISSPEGPLSYNERLSKRRAESLYNYLVDRYPSSEPIIKIGYSGEDWDGLRAMVAASNTIPNKDEVLAIIDSDLELDTKESRLKQLDGGKSWRFIVYNMLRYLRYGASAIFYYDIEYIKGLIAAEPEPEPVVEAEAEPEPEPESEPEPEPEPTITPLFALKTNLLFDAATILNVEAEIPIGKHWSIAAEWVFPWWTSCGNKNNSWQSSSSSNRNTLEILNGNIEGKYWFGDRTGRLQMTGWHLGLYAGGGKYDLEYHTKGYQGEFFIAAGLSGGYAHTILEKWIPDGNLRMEYSLGIGYMKTNYRYYEEHWGIDDSWHTLRQYNGTYSWFGPTRARVSIGWMFNRKSK